MTDHPDPRTAVVDRRAQLDAENVHPTVLSHLDDVAQPDATARDADEVYRLYRPEWTILRSFAVNREDTGAWSNLDDLMRQVIEQTTRTYRGRVRDEDIRFTHIGDDLHLVVFVLMRLPTLKGEFRYAFLAQQHADREGFDDTIIVARNSPDDHRLRGYGVTRLRAENPDVSAT